jgi:hypothetical protein
VGDAAFPNAALTGSERRALRRQSIAGSSRVPNAFTPPRSSTSLCPTHTLTSNSPPMPNVRDRLDRARRRNRSAHWMMRYVFAALTATIG